MRAEVRAYFATPIAVLELDKAPAINESLKSIIYKKEKAEQSVQASNLGGWQSSWDLESWGGDAAKAVLNQGRRLATQLTSDREGKSVKVEWKTNAWANVNRTGAANELHTHPGSYWSGTYYVDDGGISENPDLGGEFQMQDPRGIAPAMLAPLLALKVPGGQSVGACELIKPKSGLMVLFPSWLPHAVRPYHGKKARISVAFNFSV